MKTIKIEMLVKPFFLACLILAIIPNRSFTQSRDNDLYYYVNYDRYTKAIVPSDFSTFFKDNEDKKNF